MEHTLNKVTAMWNEMAAMKQVRKKERKENLPGSQWNDD